MHYNPSASTLNLTSPRTKKKGHTLVVWEVILHRADRKLLLEPIDLIQKQNDGRLDEPARVADRVKERKRLLHPVDRLILKQQLIVLRDGDQEQNRRDVFETMDPFLTLGSLTTDIEHAVCQVADDKGRLGDARRLDTRSKNVLIARQVIWLGDPGDGIKVTARPSSSQCPGDKARHGRGSESKTRPTHYRAESLS